MFNNVSFCIHRRFKVMNYKLYWDRSSWCLCSYLFVWYIHLTLIIKQFGFFFLYRKWSRLCFKQINVCVLTTYLKYRAHYGLEKPILLFVTNINNNSMKMHFMYYTCLIHTSIIFNTKIFNILNYCEVTL